ncbi:MAG: cysteine desulfurase NifS [Defluviitaleaceae bacterium]|nr:cysteine desulfurase NifS [Defluviitaleaceae bacterium]
MIYLDNAATTALRPEVFDTMIEYMRENYANPSSIYQKAGCAKVAMDVAREKIAKAISADHSNEIFFTGSGSESINWAIKSVVNNTTHGKHIITTKVEHPVVLRTCEFLEKQGFDVTYLPVDEFGMVDAQQVEEAILEGTILVAVMMANNEIGTIMPIAEIGEVIAKVNETRERSERILFFTDAIQAVGHIPVDVNALNVDMLALSGHKFYAPKGVGALYVRRGVKLMPLIHGGGQERGRRGGTENVSGIVGMGYAIDLAMAEMEAEITRQTELRDYLITQILEKIPHSRLNGHPIKRLPGNANITFDFIEGEGMLLMLDFNDIAASSGSACTSGSLDPSHVLLAVGLTHEQAHGSLRLSLGKDTTKQELDKLIEVLPNIVERLRQMSPLWEDYQRNSVT